jgi:hypothetical protein
MSIRASHKPGTDSACASNQESCKPRIGGASIHGQALTSKTPCSKSRLAEFALKVKAAVFMAAISL